MAALQADAQLGYAAEALEDGPLGQGSPSVGEDVWIDTCTGAFRRLLQGVPSLGPGRPTTLATPAMAGEQQQLAPMDAPPVDPFHAGSTMRTATPSSAGVSPADAAATKLSRVLLNEATSRVVPRHAAASFIVSQSSVFPSAVGM
ncbi:hypothetical protein [Methylobacterium gregans]|uniref:hypothetical protein n=1 Tax=Methylobacterium gregans TaxID=374424 RepID=UPI001EE1D2D4|nr:hypothetical protein [Methylobacterium gregans]MDQ0520677.1 hypothetical protein [Methylobacterium gregans]